MAVHLIKSEYLFYRLNFTMDGSLSLKISGVFSIPLNVYEGIQQNMHPAIQLVRLPVNLDRSTVSQVTPTSSKKAKKTIGRPRTTIKGKDGRYHCDLCERSFSSGSNLSRHKLQHKKEYPCVDCGRIYLRQDYLKNHQDSRRNCVGYVLAKYQLRQ